MSEGIYEGRFGKGFAFGFLFGIIGIIIVLCAWHDEPNTKRGCVVGFLVWIVVDTIISLSIFYFTGMLNQSNTQYYY